MKQVNQTTAKLAISALRAFDDALADWKPDAIKAYGLDLAVERMRDAIAAYEVQS